MDLRERIVGGLLGVAVGDALGFPVEGASRRSLEKRPVIGMVKDTLTGLASGTWSDDTSLTLCTVESLVSCRGRRLQDLADRFVRWLYEGYWGPYGEAIGIGGTTLRAIRKLRDGVSPLKAGGTREYDNGNGSLMRILPVAVFYANANAEAVTDAAHRVSRLTHAHPRSQMACGIYCLTGQQFLWGRTASEGIMEGIQIAERIYAAEPFRSEKATFERVLSLEILDEPEERIRSSGYVVDTLEAALWCVTNSSSFSETVLKAVNLGGDTDTTGAVAGGTGRFALRRVSDPARLAGGARALRTLLLR